MEEIEVDIDSLPSADQYGVLEALIATAQARVAAEHEQQAQNEYIPPELPHHAGSRVLDGGSPSRASEGHRVEDRMQTWWRRRNEKIDALRRQIEEQQRAAELTDATPMAVSVSLAPEFFPLPSAW
jgi:hypothetical protein